MLALAIGGRELVLRPLDVGVDLEAVVAGHGAAEHRSALEDRGQVTGEVRAPPVQRLGQRLRLTWAHGAGSPLAAMQLDAHSTCLPTQYGFEVWKTLRRPDPGSGRMLGVDHPKGRHGHACSGRGGPLRGEVARRGDGTGGGHAQADDVAHPGRMAPVTTPPAPGSMTVPLLFGWEHILTAVTVGVVVAVAALVVLAARKGASERSEWQAWLDARSRGHQDPVTDEHDRSTGGGSARPGAVIASPGPTCHVCTRLGGPGRALAGPGSVSLPHSS